MIRLRLCLGKEDHRSKLPFSSHHLKGTYYQHNITIDVDLDHLAGVVFVMFLFCDLTPFLFPFPYGPPWKKVTM